MASAHRLLSRQLWQVQRCSLCRHLHPQFSSQSFRTSPLSFSDFRFLSTTGVPFQQSSPAQTATPIRASFGRDRTNEDEGQSGRADRYREHYREETFASDGGRSGNGAEEGGVKSFRGWGKFSKPSTWGTKTKRVWKSKQLAPHTVDDSDGGNELYPARDFVENARRRDSNAETGRRSWHARDGSDPGAELVIENDGGVRRKVFGVSDADSKSDAGSLFETDSRRDSPSGFGRQRTEGGSKRFGVVDSTPDIRGEVSEARVRNSGELSSGLESPPRVSDSAPKKKDIIKKAYKRPGSIHSEEDRQPWVRGEKVQQVYSGLRSQVKETEEGEEDDGEPSAARDLKWGQEIDFKVYQFTPLGMRVIIRGGYDGLVYNDQLELYGRERIEIGDIMKGYVFKIRDDDKVDVSLRAFGMTQYEVDKTYLEEQLIIYGGFIPLTSKSPPDEIAAKLKLTKNGFKKAVGGLMKIGRALETEEGIVLIEADDRRSASRT